MMDREVNTPTSINMLETFDFNRVDSAVGYEVIKNTNPKTSVVKESLLRLNGAVDNLIKAWEKGYIKVIVPDDSTEILDIELQPITDLPDVLGHLTDPETFKANKDSGIWGNPDPDEFTFVQTSDFSVEAFQENERTISLGGKPKQFYRLYIDTDKVQQFRDVYLDMESIDVTPDDFGKSFVVPGGIPGSAIQKAELIEISPGLLFKFMTDLSGKLEKKLNPEEVLENGRKLKTFVDSLTGVRQE